LILSGGGDRLLPSGSEGRRLLSKLGNSGDDGAVKGQNYFHNNGLDAIPPANSFIVRYMR
jgi:hypothetical protein